MIRIINKNISIVFAALLMLFVSACETTDLNLTQNPNALGEDEASVDGYINSIQVDFGILIASLEVEASETVRILNMDGRDYANAFEPTRFDNEWEEAYQKILKDVSTMIPLANEAEQFHHVGMAQVIEAYVIVTLVDFFGDIPYAEAIQGSDDFNPGVAGDGGASVYAAALTLLDEAIVNFGRDVSAEPSDDLFYGGNFDNWIKAANSIKMKIYVTTRLVDTNAAAAFNEIVDSENFIDDNSEDFQFPWGTSFNNPDARHPNYVSDYTPSGANTYMSNWFMAYMQNSKVGNGNIAFEDADPRMKYYFYRQVASVPQNNPNLINCVAETAPDHYGSSDVFCSLPNGYWGRDHGNDEGIPPDSQLRTTFGVYPAGGRFDDNSFAVIASISLGAAGAGITPIMLASWTDMMRAEMALIANDAATANTLLQSGITKSFEKVRAFGQRDADADFSTAPSTDLDAAYVREVGQIFAAATPEDQLDLLGAEYFVTLFGNGIDGFNFYRRTGRPSFLQRNLESEPGDFFKSFFYPPVFAERNSSISQKSGVTDGVFWDPGTVTLLGEE